jgi:hypothetical protein
MTADATTIRLAHHEAGHVVAQWAVGRTPGLVTIVPGRAYAGCSFSTPSKIRDDDLNRHDRMAPLLPARLRRLYETQMLASLAGDLAVELWLASGATERTSAPVAERVAGLLTGQLAAPTRAERRMVAAEAAKPSMPSDEETTLELALVANLDDHLAAEFHIRWLRVVARQQVLEPRWAAVQLVAAALLEYRTLSRADLRRLGRG